MSMGRLAGFAFVLGACVAPLAERPEPRISVGGDSPMVAVIDRVAADTGVPAALLATLAHVGTRFEIPARDAHAHGLGAVGIFGLDPASVEHGARLAGVSDQAAGDELEAGLRAGAALLRAASPHAVTLDEFVAALEPGLRRSVVRTLARGVDGRDTDGRSIVIAARRVDIDDLDVAVPRDGGVNYPGASWTPASPTNYSIANRGVGDITHVVVHTTQGSFNGTVSWFKNPAAKVSAHYVIRSDDGFVTQMVDEKNIAWHDRCFNTETVGLEHEGFIDAPDRWYTEAMYSASAQLTAYLCDKYGIAKEKGAIVGHDTAPDCSTHTDPGPGWDWDHYIELVKTYGAASYAAEDVIVQGPPTMVSGERATFTITVTNRGNAAWEPDLTRLGTGPTDRESELFVDGDWLSPTRATGVDARVAPGEIGTFTFDIIAPEVAEPTVIDETFQLVEEDVTWFGPDIRVSFQTMPREDGGGCSSSGSSGSGVGLTFVGLGLLGLTRRRRNR